MDSHKFDRIAKTLATGASRRKALTGLVGGTLGALALGSTRAAPRTCTTCICGTGRPCNPKSTSCTEDRGFPAEQSCKTECERKGQRLCSLGNSFHCPRGCPPQS
jgi:hypothetical protein